MVQSPEWPSTAPNDPRRTDGAGGLSPLELLTQNCNHVILVGAGIVQQFFEPRINRAVIGGWNDCLQLRNILLDCCTCFLCHELSLASALQATRSGGPPGEPWSSPVAAPSALEEP